MNIFKRSFLYMAILGVVICALLILFIGIMFPRLYQEYRAEQTYRNGLTLHQQFIAGDYSNRFVENPYSTASLRITKNGSRVEGLIFAGKVSYTPSAEIQNYLREAVRQVETAMNAAQKGEATEFDQKMTFKMPPELLKIAAEMKDKLTLDAGVLEFDKIPVPALEKLSGEHSEFRQTTKNGFAAIFSISEEHNTYRNYIYVEDTTEAYLITVVAVVVPSIEHMMAVFGRSLPMLLSLVILVVILTAFIFSKQILQPIQKLKLHAVTAAQKEGYVDSLNMKRKDEIGQLADTLDELYARVQRAYDLQKEEAERRELFLRAGSHQLKTPLAAAQLLTDGMIDQVGKYKDRDHYLPVLRTELARMQKMVTALLQPDLHGAVAAEESRSRELLDLSEMAKQITENNVINLAENGLEISSSGEAFRLNGNRQRLMNILENLISNAIKYAVPQTRIEIRSEVDRLTICNVAESLGEDFVTRAFEAFATHGEQAGSGLGLYIARMEAKAEQLDLQMIEAEGKICLTLSRKK